MSRSRRGAVNHHPHWGCRLCGGGSTACRHRPAPVAPGWPALPAEPALPAAPPPAARRALCTSSFPTCRPPPRRSARCMAAGLPAGRLWPTTSSRPSTPASSKSAEPAALPKPLPQAEPAADRGRRKRLNGGRVQAAAGRHSPPLAPLHSTLQERHDASGDGRGGDSLFPRAAHSAGCRLACCTQAGQLSVIDSQTTRIALHWQVALHQRRRLQRPSRQQRVGTKQQQQWMHAQPRTILCVSSTWQISFAGWAGPLCWLGGSIVTLGPGASAECPRRTTRQCPCLGSGKAPRRMHPYGCVLGGSSGRPFSLSVAQSQAAEARSSAAVPVWE